MAYIPGGPFQMGDNLDGNTIAMPVHNVQVDSFFMDKTEVTKELWQSVQTWGNNNGYSIAAGSSYGSGHPAQSMSWYSAVVWCNARSAKEGLTPCYYADSSKTTVLKSGANIDSSMVKWNANGYRLPTEAEWEKAARGGATGLRFPWGDTITHDNANYVSYSGISYDVSQTRGSHPLYGATAPVGSFAPNSYGLFDMMGNVWEWCWDWHSISYYGTPQSLDNPTGESFGSAKINRGSGFKYDGAAGGRNSHRGGWSADGSRDDFGFRTVRR
jgi:formylglycine-generating enzyme required for sulfatase activity